MIKAMSLGFLLDFIYEDKISIYRDVTGPDSESDEFEVLYSGSPRLVPGGLRLCRVCTVGVLYGRIDIEVK